MYLLYCIFHGSEVQRQATLKGVGGRPVFPVAINGIGAAVSEISDAHLTPDLTRVMAYKKVIESFHSDRTVIPMRYGCVLRDRPQVIQLLKRNARPYESLLKELDGCVEMGIRVMIADRGSRIADFKKLSEERPSGGTQYRSAGKNYLIARKAYYAQEECITEAKDEIARQFCAALTGLFVKHKTENTPMPDRQSSMFSLYFLVPGKSIDPFRRVFRRMCNSMETTKLLLSGPWPPYNFVAIDNKQRRQAFQNLEAKDLSACDAQAER